MSAPLTSKNKRREKRTVVELEWRRERGEKAGRGEGGGKEDEEEEEEKKRKMKKKSSSNEKTRPSRPTMRPNGIEKA